jgi:hypothetical protein
MGGFLPSQFFDQQTKQCTYKILMQPQNKANPNALVQNY